MFAPCCCLYNTLWCLTACIVAKATGNLLPWLRSRGSFKPFVLTQMACCQICMQRFQHLPEQHPCLFVCFSVDISLQQPSDSSPSLQPSLAAQYSRTFELRFFSRPYISYTTVTISPCTGYCSQPTWHSQYHVHPGRTSHWQMSFWIPAPGRIPQALTTSPRQSSARFSPSPSPFLFLWAPMKSCWKYDAAIASTMRLFSSAPVKPRSPSTRIQASIAVSQLSHATSIRTPVSGLGVASKASHMHQEGGAGSLHLL